MTSSNVRSRSRIFKKSAGIILLLVAAFLLSAALLDYLPRLVRSLINSALAERNLPVLVQVRHVGFWSADLSEISVGGEKRFAGIDSIRIDYSPLGLLRKKLAGISLSGIELNLHFQDGKLIVPWQTEESTREQNAAPTLEKEDLDLLVHLGELRINSAIVNLSYGEHFVAIPCSFQARISKENPRLIRISGELVVRGQVIKTAFEIDPETMEARNVTEVEVLELRRFADFMEIFSTPVVSGRLEVQAEASMSLAPFKILAADISGKLAQTDILFGEVRLGNPYDRDEEPFGFNLTFEHGRGRLTSTSLIFNSFLAAEIGDIDLLFTSADGIWLFDGDFRVMFPEQAPAKGVSLAPTELVTQIHGSTVTGGGWRFEAASKGKKPFGLSRAGLTFSSRISGYTVSGVNSAGKTGFNYTLTLESIEIKADNLIVQLPLLTVKGTTEDGHSRFVLPFTGLDFKDTANDLKATVGGKILHSIPYNPGAGDSEINITGISYSDLLLGRIILRLTQRPSGFSFAGRHQSDLIESFCIDLAGFADFPSSGPDAEITVQASCTRSIQNFDLRRFSPTLAGYKGDGDLNLEGKLLYQGGHVSGRVDTGIDNIRLTSLDKDFALEGGSLNLHLPELPRMRSGPKQKFSFQSIRSGKIAAENGLVEFQIESAESIFIEKGQVQWSDGHVYTQALRFSPKVKDYDMIFFCDRLNFAKVLEQLGAATAEGQGRVNGRVPVHLTDGRFFIENGFLYSTPGEGGTISLSRTEILTEGIPKDTPQFAQIDLAREALKDFSYDWTKLDINSESDDNLLLHLQMNGKPTAPLPFVYNKDFGGFTRVDAGNPGSRFQGIQLDVNFRLPLNDVLHYGDSIRSLME
ncbi:MAG: YdbH domain-containing protein [Proteobacteria bacterium]|nr:YdbH domain-containing protein [Pseudomonadota bacterium]